MLNIMKYACMAIQLILVAFNLVDLFSCSICLCNGHLLVTIVIFFIDLCIW